MKKSIPINKIKYLYIKVKHKILVKELAKSQKGLFNKILLVNKGKAFFSS